jgi:23S rRNA (adenine2503-C2)-methyltransferase
MSSTPINLAALSKRELQGLTARWGWSRYRAAQLWEWLYHRRVVSFELMTNLSITMRTELAQRACVRWPSIAERRIAADGTRKLLIELEDGRRIESVLIPDERRLTLCLSTQVGCTLDCGFCLTGTMGLSRNLKAYEIVGQWVAAQQELDEWSQHLSGDASISSPRVQAGQKDPAARPQAPRKPERTGVVREDLRGAENAADGLFHRPARLTNIVFMGMGEPLANLPQLTDALARLTDPHGVAFPPRRITVSTAGLAPQIAELGRVNPAVNLAVSLNATDDETRGRIMPLAARYPITDIMAACRAYPLAPRRYITFEYVLLDRVNDSDDEARRLAALLRGVRAKVNLIPWNPFPGTPFRRPSDERIASFQQLLLDRKVPTYVRKSKGQEILAACGQLHQADRHSNTWANAWANTGSDAGADNQTDDRPIQPLHTGLN